MRKSLLVAAIATFVIAGTATAVAVTNDRAHGDCDRACHQANLARYCAQHPDAAGRCTQDTTDQATDRPAAERHRAYCAEHPDDARCARDAAPARDRPAPRDGDRPRDG